MSVRVEIVLRNHYPDGTSDEHVFTEVEMKNRGLTEMMQVPQKMILVANTIAEELVRVALEDGQL
jgi:hypothetical protein